MQTKKILIISEDKKSFPSYFGKMLLDEFEFKNGKKLPDKNSQLFVKVRVEPEHRDQIFTTIRYCGSSNPLKIVKHGNSESKNFDKVYCVFDKLKNGTDASYNNAMSHVMKPNVIRINSAPNYEFWLILHFTPSGAEYQDDDAAIKKLEELVRKETGKDKFKYKKSELQKELSKIVIEKLPDAIKRAKTIEKSNKDTNSSEPCTKIYQLIEDFKKYS